MRRITSAAGFGLCNTGNPELGTSCVSFAALKVKGCAGLECNRGEWDLTAVWQQVYAASISISLSLPMFSEMFINLYDLFMSPVVFAVRVPTIANYGPQKL